MKNEEHTTICRNENGTVYARTPLYGSEELFTDAKRQDKKDIVYIVLNVVAILLLLAFFVFCAIVNGIGDNKEKKIEQAVIEELKLQATDYGEDGDEYVVFLFPATKAYTEVSEDGGRYFLAYIIGSGTDDEGEWQLVKYEPNGNICFYDIP